MLFTNNFYYRKQEGLAINIRVLSCQRMEYIAHNENKFAVTKKLKNSSLDVISNTQKSI